MNLASRHHFCRRPTIHVGLIENDVCPHVCWPGGQHHLLAVDQIGSVESCQLKSVAMGDRVGRAGLDTISAENTAVIVDVIDLGVTLGATDAILRRILGRFNVDAVGRARSCAQKASHALLQSVFVALQHVRATETCLNSGSAQGSFPIRIVLHGRGLEHLHERDAHSLGDGGDIFQNGHVSISISKPMRMRRADSPNGD